MREHEAVDNRLTPLGPLAVMRPDDLRAVSQDVRHLLERGALLQEASGQGMPIAMRVGTLHP